MDRAHGAAADEGHARSRRCIPGRQMPAERTSDSVRAQTRGDRKELERLGESIAFLNAAVELEAHHRAEIRHLAFGEGTLRMGFESGMEHALHRGWLARKWLTASALAHCRSYRRK